MLIIILGGMDLVPFLIVTAVTISLSGPCSICDRRETSGTVELEQCEKHRLILLLVKPLAEISSLQSEM